jgi:general secretion pathway protein I
MRAPRLPRLRPRRHAGAFTLLEVMVAIAILAVGVTVLVQVQGRSAELAMQAREITVATMLARGKLYDCQTELLKKGFSIGDFDAEGNFDDEGYPTFFWECHGYKPEMPVAEGGDLSGAAGKLGLGGGGDDDAPNPGEEMGMQFLAPVLTQMSSVLGDSIRELVVIVRWGQGDEQQELMVTTHVVDKGPVNQVAAMIQQQTRALGAALGGAAGGGGPPAGPGTPGTPGTPGAPGLPTGPGGAKGPGR